MPDADLFVREFLLFRMPDASLFYSCALAIRMPNAEPFICGLFLFGRRMPSLFTREEKLLITVSLILEPS